MRKALYLATVIVGVCLAAVPACAQQTAKPYPDEIGSLYLGYGQMLAEMEPRLLTKNAKVIQFLCAPTGTRVGYITETTTPEGRHKTVSIAAAQSGDGTTYFVSDLTAGADQSTGSSMINSLLNWSDDAAYLAFDVVQGDDTSEGISVVDQLECIDLVQGSVFPVPMPLGQIPSPGDQAADATEQAARSVSLAGASWAPDEHLLAFGVQINLNDSQRDKVLRLCLFDPEQRSSRVLYTEEPPSKHFLICEGWLDTSHIAYGLGPNQFVYDLATDKLSAAPPGLPHLARAGAEPPETVLLTPDKARLELTETALTTDQNVASGAATGIWITRTGGRTKPSKLQLDVFLAPDLDPADLRNIGAQFAPSGGFDRQGAYHVIYTSEGDLKVVDLLERAASPEEEFAAGEKLTCEQEIPIAEDDARQIGLGILQYAQDFNQTFPAGSGFHDEVYPYIQSEAAFTSPNGVAFQYSPPADLNMQDMTDDSDTPLGEFDLPCADVVLMADGHVRVNQKDTTER